METMTRPREFSYEAARALIGDPDDLTKAKVLDRLDHYCRLFIAHSPFLAMATFGPSGGADCSPRGDEPGFVKVLSDRLLVIPDRVGNKLADSFENLHENPGIGLLFLVPGVRESLRINGRAYITDDPDVLPRMVLAGRAPRLATVVEVDEAYFHCGRAILRAKLWQPEMRHLGDALPSLGTMLAAQYDSAASVDAEELDGLLDGSYRNLY